MEIHFMKKVLQVFVVFALMFVTLSAQKDPVSKRILDMGKKDSQVMRLLDEVCNRIGGRPIGSDAYTNACEWAAREFKKWGMEVEMDEVGEMPVGFNRGAWFGKMLSPESMELHFGTPSYTAGTHGKQSGHAVMAPRDSMAFERIKGTLKGAWVMIDSISEGWPLDYARIKAKIPMFKQMKEAGILGFIQRAKSPIRCLYGKVDSWENLPTTPDIKLDENQFNIIKKAIEDRKEVILEFDIRNYFKPGPVKYYNVIGIIPGTKYKDEYVLVGGHMDSFDIATGAVDNGSGFTPAMEAARLIMAAGGKPKRNILITLWAGEEFGLLGSKHWVEKNKDKLDKISSVFNRDGGTNDAIGINPNAAMKKDIEQIVKPLVDLDPDYPFAIGPARERKRPKTAGGTDSEVFAVEGVPTIGFMTRDTKGYDVRYGDTWHTELDYFQKVIPEYQVHTSLVTAVTVWGVANLDHLLSRDALYLPDSAPDPVRPPMPPRDR
jgi:hypothetical protein